MWISRGYIEHLADADAAGLVVGPSLTRTSLNAVIASQVPEASTSIAGRVRLASVADAVEGTAQNLAVTPAGLAAGLAAATPTNVPVTIVSAGDRWAERASSCVHDPRLGLVSLALRLQGVSFADWGAGRRQVASIPAEFAPAVMVAVPVTLRASSAWRVETLIVQPSGVVELENATMLPLAPDSQLASSVVRWPTA